MPDGRRSRVDGDVVHEGQERRHTAGRRGAALHALAIHGSACCARHRDEVGVEPRGQGRRTEHRRRKIFDVAFVPAGDTFVGRDVLGTATLASGTYSYDVTAVLAGGVEVPGTVASMTVAPG